jgi:glycosyltransferase involved in cell wall biosynthesis
MSFLGGTNSLSQGRPTAAETNKVRTHIMKLLVFAHVPPPHHGQSYMVQLMLNGLGGDHRRGRRFVALTPAGNPYGVECFHVNVRLSKSLEDIGEFQAWKLALLFFYCLQAIWCRFRYGVTNFYYIPAPGKRSALYRDWLVLFLCRPFFKRIILHWHAAGLAKWLETVVLIRARAATYNVLQAADVSIVLSNYNRPDAEKLFPKQVRVVPNGIPDPCPDFETAVLPRRRARHHARVKLMQGLPLNDQERADAGGDPEVFRVLYLAHCLREKGLFDALDGVARANATLARKGSPIRIRLTVAGEFVNPREQEEFNARIAHSDLNGHPASGGQRSSVEYIGFAGGEHKWRQFKECDCFCFPTYYYAESFGLVVIEAMACGLAIVASVWRTIPELLTPDYPGLVPPRSPDRIADALIAFMPQPPAVELRRHFLANFTVERHLKQLSAALRESETAVSDPASDHAAPPK